MSNGEFDRFLFHSIDRLEFFDKNCELEIEEGCLPVNGKAGESPYFLFLSFGLKSGINYKRVYASERF